jgi:hypothetical protein
LLLTTGPVASPRTAMLLRSVPVTPPCIPGYAYALRTTAPAPRGDPLGDRHGHANWLRQFSNARDCGPVAIEPHTAHHETSRAGPYRQGPARDVCQASIVVVLDLLGRGPRS